VSVSCAKEYDCGVRFEVHTSRETLCLSVVLRDMIAHPVCSRLAGLQSQLERRHEGPKQIPLSFSRNTDGRYPASIFKYYLMSTAAV
jgi:hypothetical protein